MKSAQRGSTLCTRPEIFEQGRAKAASPPEGQRPRLRDHSRGSRPFHLGSPASTGPERTRSGDQRISKGMLIRDGENESDQFMCGLWRTSEGPLLLAGVPTHCESSADESEPPFEGPSLPMPVLRSGISPWASEEGNSRIRRRSRARRRRLSILSVHRTTKASERSSNFCGVALDHSAIPNPARERVCGNDEPMTCGRKRLGTLARSAGEQRAGEGLSRLAPARTALSRKTRSPLPGAVRRGEGRGGERGRLIPTP